MEKNNYIFVTGAAGFIGAALVERLLAFGYKVIGLDNLNNYYDVSLKKARLESISIQNEKYKSKWLFFESSLEEEESLKEIFTKYKPTTVYNLAAQAGVRYSIENPKSYISSNLIGFSNILEMCRNFRVENFIYASSSSIYGGNQKIPFSEKDNADHPVSLYAATKRSNELLAHSYSSLYKIPCTGLRFFTVYGPWGRPDMAPMIFTRSILNNQSIDIFNYGKMQRDFTYIEDVIDALFALLNKPASVCKEFDFQNPNPSISFAPYRVFNVGNSQPVDLLDFVNAIEKELNLKAIYKMKPMQMGDVEVTYANTNQLNDWIGYSPSTNLENGIKKFIGWYKSYYS